MNRFAKQNNIFVYESGEQTRFLSADDITFLFSGVDISTRNFKCEPTDILGKYRLARMRLYANIVIEYKNATIQLAAHVIRNANKTDVAIINNQFADYIIDESNNSIYLLNNDLLEVNKIIFNYGYSIDNINFQQYIEIKKILAEKNIRYDDTVTDFISDIKKNNEHFVLKGLKGSLYTYQDIGCNWLAFMERNKCGCILGDEMGLGKTLQIIALLGSLKETKSNIHSLIICPVSLLENWKREIQKFYPSLSTYIHYGTYRTGDYSEFLNYEVIILPYSTMLMDICMLNMVKWDIVVLDEAQNIKNPRARRTKAAKQLNRGMAIAISGTPFENHVSDIWSVVDFVLPGFLGTLSQFEQRFTDDLISAQEIEQLISPILLRRRVAEVDQDLPERVDISVPLIMSDEEASYYEEGRKALIGMTEDSYDLDDKALCKIQGLRMFCTHPIVYDKAIGHIDPITVSAKYERLCEILEEIFANGEKAIIFTSFNKMIDILTTDIKKRYGVYTNYIDGRIDATSRQSIIDEFTTVNGAGILALNPKAAGAGLNITAANHVIHYNLEWNPSLMEQASKRAHRNGQKKVVFIHKLYYVNTIEEFILEKLDTKTAISDTAIIGHVGDSYSKEDLIKALNKTPYNTTDL